MAAPTQPIETQIKKRNDAYTGFLAISFLAMAGGAVLLWLEYQNYENKPLPQSPKIDVPGIPGKAIPGTGGAPKAEPKAPEEPAKEMMLRPKLDELPPALLPAVDEGTQVVGAVTPVERSAKPIIEIPDVPPAPIVIQAAASEVVQPVRVQPSAPEREPELTDAPPIPIKRFTPPK